MVNMVNIDPLARMVKPFGVLTIYVNHLKKTVNMVHKWC